MKHAHLNDPDREQQVSATEKDQLLALLARQQGYVSQLAALAEQQGECVRSGDAEALLELLGRRQELLDLVIAAQREVAPLAARIERSALDPVERQRAMKLMDEIKNGLTVVMKQDDLDRAAIQEAREKILLELNTIGQTRQARHAYTPRGSTDPRFADRQG